MVATVEHTIIGEPKEVTITASPEPTSGTSFIYKMNGEYMGEVLVTTTPKKPLFYKEVGIERE
jgi:hypothetical protein